VTVIEVKILDHAGEFAADKDEARNLRETYVMPALQHGQEIELNFVGVRVATQSFVHALISLALRVFGEDALGLLVFSNCSQAVQAIIETVVDYTLSAPGSSV
jgi:hypothetical protein